MRTLITGMSGTGKTSVVGELHRRGFVAHDLDEGYTCVDPEDGRWHWRTADVRRLLTDTDKQSVVIAGCSEEQVEFTWDLKVLLTAPEPVMLHRLATRAGNTFGQSSAQRAQVLADLANVEPVLRQSAHVIIETTLPLADVVDLILHAANETWARIDGG